MNAYEVIALDGLRDHAGSPVDAVRDAVRRLVWDAVIVADMAAFNDLVALDELWPYALAHAA